MTHLNATEGTKKLRSIIDGRLFLQGSIFAFDDATFENSKKKRSEELVVQKNLYDEDTEKEIDEFSTIKSSLRSTRRTKKNWIRY